MNMHNLVVSCLVAAYLAGKPIRPREGAGV